MFLKVIFVFIQWNYKTGDFNHRNMNDQLPEEQIGLFPFLHWVCWLTLINGLIIKDVLKYLLNVIDENKVNQKKEDKKAFSIQNNSAKQIRPFKNLK